MKLPEILIRYPAWLPDAVALDRVYATDSERMRLAVELARRNVEAKTGGPFGAAVFETDSGRLIAVGVNLVVRNHNAILHGEIVALMAAQARLGSFTLSAPAMPSHDLFTSCEPCAMCLGATLWSGVKRLVCGANRDDAVRLNFDEGPVFKESYDYLERRGIRVLRGIERAAAVDVLELYRSAGGQIYNP